MTRASGRTVSIIISLASCIYALFVTPSIHAQTCNPLSSYVATATSAGRQLSVTVHDLEEKRTPPRPGNASVLVKTVTLDESLVKGIDDDQKTQVFQAISACFDRDGVERATRKEAQDDVNFVVGGDRFQDLLDAAKRIEQVGIGNIDSDTRNLLRQKDINYIVYLSPRFTARKGSTTYDIALSIDLDVVSVESGIGRSASSSKSTQIVGQYPRKLESGEGTVTCGCWGFVVIGQQRPNPICKSGFEVAQPCNVLCPGGGYAWGAICK